MPPKTPLALFLMIPLQSSGASEKNLVLIYVNKLCLWVILDFSFFSPSFLSCLQSGCLRPLSSVWNSSSSLLSVVQWCLFCRSDHHLFCPFPFHLSVLCIGSSCRFHAGTKSVGAEQINAHCFKLGFQASSRKNYVSPSATSAHP